MPIRTVESTQNARVKELRRAFAHTGRDGRGPAAGAPSVVGIEGPKMLEEALRAGLRVRTVFTAQGSEKLLDPFRFPPETEILRVPRTMLVSVLMTETPQPVAALVEPPRWTWEQILNPNQKKTLVVVLAGIQDPGNLGTILRSAEAFGASGMVSLPGTVTAWNPKAVRASAGSVFRVPVVAASVQKCFEQLREAGARILATTARGASPADQVEMAGSIALIIGNEGNGVSDELLENADAKISIPCPGPVESLNAAMAATVLLYEAARQRTARTSAPSGSSRDSSTRLPHAVGARR
jgi:RNA methyltransferase, TrmH family